MPFRMSGAAWPWIVAGAAAGALAWWYRSGTALPAVARSSGLSAYVEEPMDEMDRTVADSFPASDPPAWSGATAAATGADRSEERW